jgi:hypothetical protein
MAMELMRTKTLEEVVFGKGFVPVLAAFFTGTEDELKRFSKLKNSAERIHIVIDRAGVVTFTGEGLQDT